MMISLPMPRADSGIFRERGRRWGILLLLTLAANAVLWNSGALPCIRQWKKLKAIYGMVHIKPELEALHDESVQELERWRGAMVYADASAAIRQILEMADESGVRIREINRKGTRTSPRETPFPEMVFSIKAEESYDRLIHWIRMMESRPGIRVQAWSLLPAEKESHGNRLNLDLKLSTKNVL